MSKYNFDLNLEERNTLTMIVEQVEAGTKVLEFGLAHGRLTKYLAKNLNCDVDIVEIDEEAASDAKQFARRACVGTLDGDINNKRWQELLQGNFYDYIIFADVLEHVMHPWEVLKDCKGFLKQDGRMLCSIPNIANDDVVNMLLHDKVEYQSLGLLDNTHIRFFTYDSLRENIAKLGLYVEIEDATKIPMGYTELKYNQIHGYSDLKKSNHGDVYQIFLSLKKEPCKKISKIVKTDQQCHIYLPADGIYSEEYKLTVITEEQGESKFCARFELSNLKVFDKMRFAPIKGIPCRIDILGIETDGEYKSIVACNGTPTDSDNEFDFYNIEPILEICGNFEKATYITLTYALKSLMKIETNKQIADLLEERYKLQQRNKELEENYKNLSAKNRNLEAEKNKEFACLTASIKQQSEQLYKAQQDYEIISTSNCWKITAPIRCILDKFKWWIVVGKTFKPKIRKAFYILKNEGVFALFDKIKTFLNKEKDSKREEKSRSTNNFYRDNLTEPNIPLGWVEILRFKPLITIIVPIKEISNYMDYVKHSLDSLSNQIYKHLEIILVCSCDELVSLGELVREYKECLNITTVDVDTESDWETYIDKALSVAQGEYVGILEQYEILTENAVLYAVDGINDNKAELCLIPDDVLWKDGEYCSADYKIAVNLKTCGIDTLLHFGIFKNNGFHFTDGSLRNWLSNLDSELLFVAPWIGCHLTPIESLWKCVEKKTRFLAFYLPQFHEIPENNQWWGKGFTEWTNVKKAKSLYEGHEQPRVPGELGYYNLGDEGGAEVQMQQISLAKEYGLSGFCYYYYWFDGGKRLLEKPLDRHLYNKEMDFPFCLCWANENWTRQWDGLKSDILMPQSYAEGWEEKFILDTLPYLKDERYIRVNGAPYLLIYNLEDIKNPEESINTWRRIAAEHGIERLHVSAVRRSIDAREFKVSGNMIDSLTDFPPHLLGLVNIDHDQPEKFGLPIGQVKDYKKACDFHINMSKQMYTYFRTVFLKWDNTARKGEKAHIFENFSYNDYKKWLYAAKRYTVRNNRDGEDLTFINAWNEWAEGTYLEPTESDGRAALEATKHVLKMR